MLLGRSFARARWLIQGVTRLMSTQIALVSKRWWVVKWNNYWLGIKLYIFHDYIIVHILTNIYCGVWFILHLQVYQSGWYLSQQTTYILTLWYRWLPIHSLTFLLTLRSNVRQFYRTVVNIYLDSTFSFPTRHNWKNRIELKFMIVLHCLLNCRPLFVWSANQD